MEQEAQAPSAPCTGEAGKTGEHVDTVDPTLEDTDTRDTHSDVEEEDEPDAHQQDDQTLQPAPDQATQGDTLEEAEPHEAEDLPKHSEGQVDNAEGTEGEIDQQASVEECYEEEEEEDEDGEGERRHKKVVIVETGVYTRMEYLDVISLDEPVQVELPPDVAYRMDHPKRGVAVIFNNGTFSSLLELPDRVGYKEDGAMLKEGFAAVGFDVRYYQDLTVQNIVTVLSLVIMEGHEDADCIAVVFMTHGLQQPGTTNDVIFGKDGPLWIHNIVAKFNGEGCRSLAGKPKLFFVEASRGTQVDTGVKAKADTETDAGRRKKTIPLEADILLAQSTVAGYTSFPTDPCGSVYIRSLARTLTEYGSTQDIHWLLTRVNFLVAEQFESTSVDKAMNRKRQMPTYSSTLTKVLSFPQQLKQDEFYL